VRLRELIAPVAGARVLGDQDPEITGVSTDSRTLRQGDVFVAIRGGEEQDRHPYVPEAVARGAPAVVVEEAVAAGTAAVVQVPSTRRALPLIAERLYHSPGDLLRLVGITGTNGKTTTSYLVHAVLKAAGWEPGLLGTVEYLVGGTRRPSANSTPEAHELQRMMREMVEAGCRSAVMEVTSHGLALGRVDGIRFKVGVFTNLTRDHLNFHKTFEAYLAAKAALFDSLGRDAFAVVNADDAASERVVRKCVARTLRYGASAGADVRVVSARTDWRGSEVELSTPAGHLGLRLTLRGRFNFWNTAAAAATALCLEVPPQTIEQAMREVRVPGRFEGVDRGQPFGVIVDYAHTPDALKNVLEAARALTQGRLICVFGCGGDRDRGKRPQMGATSAELCDLSVVTSDNPRTEDPEAIIREILPGLGDAPCLVESDRRLAIQRGLREAAPGDVVVIAGKGHEDYQILGRDRIHFDDREVASEALTEMGHREQQSVVSSQ